MRSLAALCLMALVASGCAAPTPSASAGTAFRGDGYALALPPEFDWTRTNEPMSIVDTWMPKGRVPYLVTVNQFSLAPGQQNLEAVRSRMTVFLAGLRWTTSEPTPVSLPAGPAYRLEGTGEWGRTVAYAFYRDGRGIVLTALDMNPSDAVGIDPEQIARGFRIEARAMGPATSAAPARPT